MAENGKRHSRYFAVGALVVFCLALITTSSLMIIFSISLIVSSIFARLISVVAAFFFKVVAKEIAPLKVGVQLDSKISLHEESLPESFFTPIPGVPRLALKF